MCRKDSRARFAPHGLCPNRIGVVVVEYEDLIVARAGRRDETPGLICEDLSAVIVDGSVTEVYGCRIRDWWGRGRQFLRGLVTLAASQPGVLVERWFFLVWSI